MKVADTAEYEVDADGCWLWLGRIDYDGYGIADGFPIRSMHRVKYIERFGLVEPGLVLDHRCHSYSDCQETTSCKHRRCCNPEHLAAVTKSENSLLRYRRGTRETKDTATAAS